MLAAIVDVAREVSKCQVNPAGAHKQQSNQQQDPPNYNGCGYFGTTAQTTGYKRR